MEVFRILNVYDINIDINISFSHKKDIRPRGHQVTLVKEWYSLDIRKYPFTYRTIN